MTIPFEAVPDELPELLAALREETLDGAQAARLETLICDSPAARRAYIEYQHMVADLRWLCGNQSPALPSNPSPAAPLAPAPSAMSSWMGQLQSLPWVDAAPLIIFGMLMLAVGLVVGMRLGDREPVAVQSSHELPEQPATVVDDREAAASPLAPQAAPTFATLTRTLDSEWEAGALPTHAGARLATGKLRLTKGVAQITFDSGAEVLVEGPAVFELTSARDGTLSFGKLVAHVPPAAIGFTIRTSSAAVVDLGTEFGVIAEAQGATEVHVFDGKVELEVLGEEADSPVATESIELVAGQARRLEPPAEDEVAAALWLARPFDGTRFVRQIAPVEESVLGDLLLTDDFQGDKLDRSRWRVITEGIRSSNAKILVEEGHVELSNRAHLVTREQYDPAQLGGLRLRGRWTFESENDTMQILTRSDGVPNPATNGDTQNGVEFIANTEQGGVMGIYGRGEAELPFAIALVPIQVGDTFDFEIVDDGTNVSLTLTEVGGEGATATVSTVCHVDRATDFVVFHNREQGRKSRRALLEHVSLEGNLRPNPALPAEPPSTTAP